MASILISLKGRPAQPQPRPIVPSRSLFLTSVHAIVDSVLTSPVAPARLFNLPRVTPSWPLSLSLLKVGRHSPNLARSCHHGLYSSPLSTPSWTLSLLAPVAPARLFNLPRVTPSWPLSLSLLKVGRHSPNLARSCHHGLYSSPLFTPSWTLSYEPPLRQRDSLTSPRVTPSWPLSLLILVPVMRVCVSVT